MRQPLSRPWWLESMEIISRISCGPNLSPLVSAMGLSTLLVTAHSLVLAWLIRYGQDIEGLNHPFTLSFPTLTSLSSYTARRSSMPGRRCQRSRNSCSISQKTRSERASLPPSSSCGRQCDAVMARQNADRMALTVVVVHLITLTYSGANTPRLRL